MSVLLGFDNHSLKYCDDNYVYEGLVLEVVKGVGTIVTCMPSRAGRIRGCGLPAVHVLRQQSS